MQYKNRHLNLARMILAKQDLSLADVADSAVECGHLEGFSEILKMLPSETDRKKREQIFRDISAYAYNRSIDKFKVFASEPSCAWILTVDYLEFAVTHYPAQAVAISLEHMTPDQLTYRTRSRAGLRFCGMTALHFAVQYNRLKVVGVILNTQFGRSLLNLKVQGKLLKEKQLRWKLQFYGNFLK